MYVKLYNLAPVHQNGPPRFGLFWRALAIRRAAGRMRLRSPLRLSKEKLWHFRRESQSCVPVRQDSPLDRLRHFAGVRPRSGFVRQVPRSVRADIKEKLTSQSSSAPPTRPSLSRSRTGRRWPPLSHAVPHARRCDAVGIVHGLAVGNNPIGDHA